MPAPDHLLANLVAGLHDVPGIDSAHLFGSMARNTHDDLSDIDVQVFVTDVTVAWSVRYRLVQRIGPVLLELALTNTADDRASTFLFQGVGPVHKLDLGYMSTAERERWIGSHTNAVVWRRDDYPDRDPPIPDPVNIQSMAPQDPFTHAILDQLIGASRYVKARRRGQVVVAWRFAIALAEATLAVSASELLERPYPGRKLTTPEYLELDPLLPRSVHASLIDSLFMADVTTMDDRVATWVSYLGQLVSQSAGDDAVMLAAFGDLVARIRQEVAAL